MSDDDGIRYGADTAAAIRNFDVSGERVPWRIIAALTQIKAAAAIANGEPPGAGVLTDEVAQAIVAGADQILAGGIEDQFPIDVFQTGSGTSTNMNVNEVIASLATERLGAEVHPNDHVNASQSTNDTFPTAIRVAALGAYRDELLPALTLLERELALKARQLAAVVKPGRTHLMDATPVTLGQEFGSYRAQIRESIERLDDAAARLGAVPLGGTATGNGVNVPEGYPTRAVAVLARRTGLALSETPDRLAAQGSQDAIVEMSAQVRGAAMALFKIANDIRWMSSGPRTGLAEITLPDLQPGSSIMPGKVNPIICEVAIQVCAQVFGNDAAIAFAGSQGNLELNVFLPLMARNLLESISLLAGASSSLATRCVVGIAADVDRCRTLAESSPAIATALNPVIGYEAATEVVRKAAATGRTIREVVVAEGLLTDDEAAELLNVTEMAKIRRVEPGDLVGEDPVLPPEQVPPGERGAVGPTAPDVSSSDA